MRYCENATGIAFGIRHCISLNLLNLHVELCHLPQVVVALEVASKVLRLNGGL